MPSSPLPLRAIACMLLREFRRTTASNLSLPRGMHGIKRTDDDAIDLNTVPLTLSSSIHLKPSNLSFVTATIIFGLQKRPVNV